MEVIEYQGDRRALRELLLLADPSEELVAGYLQQGILLAALEGGEILGEALAIPAKGGWELKNLAVHPAHQRRGIGGRLVKELVQRVPEGTVLWVGTGNSSPWILRFYERCGFSYDHTVKNFFTDNYPDPIWEDGVLCTDMIYLKQRKGYFPMDSFETPVDGFRVRYAREADTALILCFIRELADYEQMLDQVVADEATLHEWLFVKRKAEVLIGEMDGKPVGFALFFHNFSTFLGRAGLYLEDLYVRPELRGRGLGKALLARLAAIAVERGCGRMEWWCLDWNRPSIDFYRSLGAEPMEDWTVYRLTGDTLSNLARQV